MAQEPLRRTWAEIDLDALEYNFKTIRSRVGSARCMGVVKADAYGHGAVQAARCLEAWGADYLAVSSLDEAVELRRAKLSLPILILGHTPPEMTPQLIEHRIAQAVASPEKARQYSAEALRCGGSLRVHMMVDTGMSRLGFRVRGAHFEEGAAALAEACSLPGLEPEGIFTHFAVSDEDAGEAYTREQFDLFTRTIAAAQERGASFAIRHCANSGAIARYPEMYLDMVRPGIILYGLSDDARRLGLRPVMTLKTCISDIRELDEATTVSYGRTWRAERTTRMGVIPIGYADGVPRSASNRISVLTEAGPAPVRGRICMDMMMVDLTELPSVPVGGEAEFFGSRQRCDDLAAFLGTIPHELLCAVSKRVPRVYLRQGREVERTLRILA